MSTLEFVIAHPLVMAGVFLFVFLILEGLSYRFIRLRPEHWTSSDWFVMCVAGPFLTLLLAIAIGMIGTVIAWWPELRPVPMDYAINVGALIAGVLLHRMTVRAVRGLRAPARIVKLPVGGHPGAPPLGPCHTVRRAA